MTAITEIAFHFGTPNKLAYACRLLRKASGMGARLIVLGNSATIQRLDADLWALSATDFIAHCADSAPVSMQNRSSVVLTSRMNPALWEGRNVLVNLSESEFLPEHFAQFPRVIEIVSTDETDAHFARQRWRSYKQEGFALKRHDLRGQEGN